MSINSLKSVENMAASSVKIQKIERIDLRRRRADYFTVTVLEEIKDLLPNDVIQEVHHRLFKVFHENGACIITDEERRAEGLEPRDELGWTPSERLAQNQLKPKTIQMTAPNSSFS